MTAFGGFMIVGVQPKVALQMLVHSPFVMQAVLSSAEEVFYASPTIERFVRTSGQRVVDFSVTFEADREVTVIGSKLWFQGDMFMEKDLTAGPKTIPQGHTLTLIQPVEIHVDPHEGRSDWEQMEINSKAMLAAMGRTA